MSNKRPNVVAVAFEGPCYAGKSTLISKVNEQIPKTKIISEYSNLCVLPPFPPADITQARSALEELLIVEKGRSDVLLEQSSSGIYLMDRSPICCIAFEYAKSKLGIPSELSLSVQLFSEAAESGQVYEPDGYVYMDIKHEIARQRALVRGPVLPFLMDPVSLKYFVEIYDCFFMEVMPQSRCIRLDGGELLQHCVDATIAFIEDVWQLGPDQCSRWPSLLSRVCDAIS